MTMRLILAAVLGAIAMFFWSYVAHDLIPIAFAGIKEIPKEKEVSAALDNHIGDNPGTYMFPARLDLTPPEEKERRGRSMAEYAKKSVRVPDLSFTGQPAVRLR